MNERSGTEARQTDDTDTRTNSQTDTRMSTADLAYGRDGGKMNAPAAGEAENERVALIDEGQVGGYRQRWTSIQTKFIDEPRETVSDADELVAEVIQGLARRFAEERQTLEQQWQSGSEVSTEDLRQAMQHYRSFFERLLAA
jgi:hypothetical protein